MPRTVPDVVPAGTMREREQPMLATGSGSTLRPWLASDGPAVVEAFSDPAIQRWHTRDFSSTEEAAAWAMGWASRWNAETDASWAVIDDETGVLRGYVALRSVDLEMGVAHVSYWTVAAARGRGVASSAVGALVRWASGHLGLQRLEVRHAIANEPSCRVAVKCGFALEGIAKRSELLTDGWHDMHMHARIGQAP